LGFCVLGRLSGLYRPGVGPRWWGSGLVQGEGRRRRGLRECAPGWSAVAPLGWSAFWRHHCGLARIDLLPASCQAIDFRPAGPTIVMVS